MNKNDGMQQTNREDKRREAGAASRPTGGRASRLRREVMLEPEERTPEEAGYGYGV